MEIVIGMVLLGVMLLGAATAVVAGMVCDGEGARNAGVVRTHGGVDDARRVGGITRAERKIVEKFRRRDELKARSIAEFKFQN